MQNFFHIFVFMIIDVLATGPSLNRFNKENRNKRVGVNKIVRQHRVNYLVCVDVASSFNKDVIEYFKRGYMYDLFFSNHKNEWSNIIPSGKFRHIELERARGVINLHSNKLPQSVSSPYVAVALAYKIGAKIIDLYGADYNNHPSFGEDRVQTILTHFDQLQTALLQNKCSMRCTPESRLSEILPIIPQSRLLPHTSLESSLPHL